MITEICYSKRMTKQQRLVLVLSILASFVAFLDGAIVNVALPAISSDLGGGLSSQQWIIDAYLLTLGSLILIAGSLSDLLGRRKILTLGLLGFGAASLLCAVAPSAELLIIGRALQGVAGALLVPSSLALIISTFSGAAQAKAVGSWTAWTGISFIIGPLLGGILIAAGSWRWIFAINVVPIALTLFLMTKLDAVKEVRSTTPVDITGAVLCAIGLGGPVFALIEQPRYGWDSPVIYIPLIGGIILFFAFLIYESRTKYPMLKLDLFKNRNFSVGNIATLAIYAGLTASTFILIVFLQQVGGYSALAAGLALLPITIIMFFLSSRFGALSGKYGPRLFMSLGPIIGGLGILLMLRVGADVQYWTELFPAIMIFGLGLSITVAPLTAAILGDVPKTEAGIASAVNNAVARVAGLVAVAAVGAVIAAQFASSLDNSQIANNLQFSTTEAKKAPLQIVPPKPYQNNQNFQKVLTEASVTAFHTGILAVAILIISGGIISAIGIKNPPRKP